MRTDKLYTTLEIPRLKANIKHKPMCSKVEFNKCKQAQKCLERLTGLEAHRILGVHPLHGTFKSLDRYKDMENSWRQKQFKKCKLVIFTIKRGTLSAVAKKRRERAKK